MTFQILVKMEPKDLSPRADFLLKKLIAYIRREWIERNDFSIYQSVQKTNICCEVYHRELKAMVRVKRPNIWSFIVFLKKNVIKYDQEYQRFMNGLPIGERRKKILKLKRDEIDAKKS